MPNPRPHPALTLALTLALVLAACGGAAPSGGATGSSHSPAGSIAPATARPGSTSAVSIAPGGTWAPPTKAPATKAPPTKKPVETAPAASADPGESPAPGESGDPTASPEASDGPAAACSGTKANRDFYAGAASRVDWTVLCAVLPKGWFVFGSYRLADGGKLLMVFKGPAGARLELSEGAYCVDAGACVPPGTTGDAVPLGPMTGTLVRLDDGGFAIVADRGLNPSWLLVSHGLDEATSRGFGAALQVVSP